MSTTTQPETASTEEKHIDLEASRSNIPSPTASDDSLARDKDRDDDEGVLKGAKLKIVVAALMLTILCVALDNTSKYFTNLADHH